MSNLDLPSPAARRGRLARWHAWAVGTSVLFFVGLVLGGLVNSTDATLVDPDWPGFPSWSSFREDPRYGIEWVHRPIMGAVLIATFILAWGVARAPDASRTLKRLAIAAAALVTVNAGLGALTVLAGKSTAGSIAHVGVAMLFALALWSVAAASRSRDDPREPALEPGDARRVAIAANVLVGLVWLQIVLGSVPRHATAETGGKTLLMVGDALHILGAFALFAGVIFTYIDVTRRARKSGALLRPVLLLLFLLVAQGFLGFVAFFYQPKDPPSVSSLGMRESAAVAPLDPPGSSRAPGVRETADARGEERAHPRDAAGDARAARGEASTSAASPAGGGPWFDGHAISASVHQTVGFLLYAVAIAFASRAWRRARGPAPGGDPETSIATSAETVAEAQAGGRA